MNSPGPWIVFGFMGGIRTVGKGGINVLPEFELCTHGIPPTISAGPDACQLAAGCFGPANHAAPLTRSVLDPEQRPSRGRKPGWRILALFIFTHKAVGHQRRHRKKM